MSDETEKLDRLIALYGKSIAGKLWRGSQAKQGHQGNQRSINTGYESINKQLYNQGWPLGTINEFGTSRDGIGELRLLMPALRALQQSSLQQSSRPQSIILIAPPYSLFAPALVKENIDLRSLTIVKTNTLKESLWAAEQSLAGNCCAAVIFWTGTHHINTHDLRRLQLAVEKTQSWGVLFRHSRCLSQASVSGLRVQLDCNSHSKLELSILKQPQGWGGQKCTVSLEPHYENWQRLPVNLLPVNIVHQPPEERPIRTHNAKAESQSVTHPKAWHSSVTIIAPLSALQTVH